MRITIAKDEIVSDCKYLTFSNANTPEQSGRALGVQIGGRKFVHTLRLDWKIRVLVQSQICIANPNI